MERTLRDGTTVIIRPYQDTDFEAIQLLNKLEGWNHLASQNTIVKHAWQHSNIAFVAIVENTVIGYIRGLTDGYITTYVAELLIKKDYQSLGLGKYLLLFVQNLYPKTRVDLLASRSSQGFYAANHFRPFYGYRRTMEEIES